jgi:hypothetical protein
MSKPTQRFRVAKESAIAESSRFNWQRLLTVYGAIALGTLLVLNRGYLFGAAFILWGISDF